MPENIAPMKGMLADAPPRGAGWLYEIKWDGVRAICLVENGALRMISRSGKSCERQYPELSVLPHYVQAREAVLDGEICVLDERGRPRFNLIQPRIMVSDPASIAAQARSRPANLFLFDLLYLDGYDLRGVPLAERKKLLKSVVKPGGVIRISESFDEGENLLEAAREQELEGILAKRADSRYEARRSNTWLKIKTVRHNECVICGYTEGERDYFGALVLGVYEKGTWCGPETSGQASIIADGRHSRASAAAARGQIPFRRTPQDAQGRDLGPAGTGLHREVRRVDTRRPPARACVHRIGPDVEPKEAVRESVSTVAEEPEAEEPEPAKISGTLLSESQTQAVLDIDGRSIKFTNLNKIFYPKEGYAKRDLINYYNAVSSLILPHLRDRPLSLKRYPNGIHSDFFFQKRSAESFPEWLRTEPIYSEHNKAPNQLRRGQRPRFAAVPDESGVHRQNPWMSRVGSLDSPDYILIDLDPQECSYDLIVEAALLVRENWTGSD
jgi:bifunctional non-homologous end joining protein LigD